MRIDRDKCTNCEACMEVGNQECSVNAFKKDFRGNVIINQDVCNNCGKCVGAKEICPKEAIVEV